MLGGWTDGLGGLVACAIELLYHHVMSSSLSSSFQALDFSSVTSTPALTDQKWSTDKSWPVRHQIHFHA